MKKIGAFTIKSPHRCDRLHSGVNLFVPGNPSKRMGKPLKAVWDTGATSSCISQKAVRALGLQRVSYRKIYTVNSSAEVKTYYVGLELPNYFMTTVTASALASISDDVDVVIGMDVISRGDFSVTNVLGKTTFSFRIPSVREVDYEQEPLMNGE